jgi:hypothetical protein
MGGFQIFYFKIFKDKVVFLHVLDFFISTKLAQKQRNESEKSNTT